ncbi:head maturation protease [Bacillus phage Shbh1]|uniref:Putative prohead protease n=1 Tax=Bacillus phage Shbh1 TaxID=1796992 RepID=A0A142F1D4_9CAUD|nr:head maturation protease [Bacillus phage Shbh1]AMQ66591.1 putative prohead protease [Bacillus phage Shbh1]
MVKSVLDKQTGRFDIFAPIDISNSIEKSNKNPNDKSWYVKGYATTPDLDLQEDIIDPKGIEISHFLQHGYLNYEHYQGDEYKIGAPTDGTHVDDVGLYVEGKLYKHNPYAKSIWDLANNIAKSGIDRKLGFSIEGFARKRNDEDPRIIEKCYITNVAITTNPANPQATWDAILKTFVTGHGITPETQVDGAALRAESFARSLYNLSFTYKACEDPTEFKELWKEIGSYLDSMDRYSHECAIMYLQLSKGYSRKEAITKLDKWLHN